jgi:hypothetical protein
LSIEDGQNEGLLLFGGVDIVASFINLPAQGLPFLYRHAPTHTTHLFRWPVSRIAANKRLAGARTCCRSRRRWTVRVRRRLTVILLRCHMLACGTTAQTARKRTGKHVPYPGQEQKRYCDIFKPHIHCNVGSSKRLTINNRPLILKFKLLCLSSSPELRKVCNSL